MSKEKKNRSDYSTFSKTVRTNIKGKLQLFNFLRLGTALPSCGGGKKWKNLT